MRAAAAVALALALAGCGFEPVHGPGGTGALLQDRIRVDRPVDRAGYLLVRRLEERLGRGRDPAYRLAVDLDAREEIRAIDPGGDIRRPHVVGRAGYALSDIATGAVLRSGSVDGFTGYFATGTNVAALAAKRDATRRLMTILADRIVLELQASGP